MRPTLFLATLSLGIFGCGPAAEKPEILAIPAARATSPATPSGPKVGDRVVYPTIGAAYVDAESVRESDRLNGEASRLRKAGQSDEMGPDRKSLARRTVGTLWAGDLLEILEVGEDYAVVNVLKGKDGEPGKVHGYTKRWW